MIRLLEPFNVSLDNVTIVGDKSRYIKFEQVLANSVLWTERYRAKYPYEWNWNGIDGSFLQYTNENNFKNIRIEFNPNKCSTDEIIKVLRSMRNSKLTRVDLAFDFEVDLTEFTIFDSIKRKETVIKGTDRKIETIYFGSRASDLQIRIYDKSREQNLSDRTWWRIEVQLRNDILDFVRNGSVNPFFGLRIFKPVYNGLHWRDEAVIRAMLETDYFVGKMEKTARSRYKKKITNLKASDELELINLFEKYKQHLLYDITKWLDYANEDSLRLLK